MYGHSCPELGGKSAVAMNAAMLIKKALATPVLTLILQTKRLLSVNTVHYMLCQAAQADVNLYLVSVAAKLLV